MAVRGIQRFSKLRWLRRISNTSVCKKLELIDKLWKGGRGSLKIIVTLSHCKRNLAQHLLFFFNENNIHKWFQWFPLVFHEDHIDESAADVKVTFINKDGSESQVVGKVGQNLLRLAQKNDIELEGKNCFSIEFYYSHYYWCNVDRCLWMFYCMLDLPCNFGWRNIQETSWAKRRGGRYVGWGLGANTHVNTFYFHIFKSN